MVFSSPVFLFLFLPVTLAVYLLLWRQSLRNIWLLIASLFFYAWGEQFLVLVMLASIGFNHAMALAVARTRERQQLAKLMIFLAVSGNLALLAYWKYANFIVANLNRVIEAIGSQPLHWTPVHLPIGISFFTFQAMSYVIDVYRRNVPPERNLLRTALYITMFPQLIAGPIVRYCDVADAIRNRVHSLGDFAAGIRIFTVGLAKKMILANTLGEVADGIIGHPVGNLAACSAWSGIIAYSLQIYFDFSGYSDMAIGLGRMFGFRFAINFQYPYISQSIREFWKRWHISLSTWFRDYLYIPLGGSRQSPRRTYANLIIVFALCGLWHGASWNFLVWGLFHGLFLALERCTGNRLPGIFPAPLRWLYAMSVVTIGWVFFRIEDFGAALTYLGVMCGAQGLTAASTPLAVWWNPRAVICLLLAIPACTPLAGALNARIQKTAGRFLASWQGQAVTAAAEWAWLACIWVVSAALLACGTYNPFIYFRF